MTLLFRKYGYILLIVFLCTAFTIAGVIKESKKIYSLRLRSMKEIHYGDWHKTFRKINERIDGLTK